MLEGTFLNGWGPLEVPTETKVRGVTASSEEARITESGPSRSPVNEVTDGA
jgi:hypothetical protein